MARPEKLDKLLGIVGSRVEDGEYLVTRHAQQRQAERGISRPEIEYVLTHGWHEKRKDTFDAEHHAWNYAIRGRTFGDERELRIIVSFDGDMVIVTVIDLEN